MQVIDAVKVHVLRMPGEAGLPATKVEISRVDTVYLNPIVFLHKVQYRAQVFNIPAVTRRVSDGSFQVCSIKRSHKCDVFPVLPL